MNPPFKLPVHWVDQSHYCSVLVAKDNELIGEVNDATPDERAYIALAINHHEQLKTALINLLKVEELNYDDDHAEGTKSAVDYAYGLLAALGEGGHK